MESDRVMKIEKRVGLALMIVNCIRLAFWWHTPNSVAVPGDILALFGAILYFRALRMQRKQI
jgi:hypothetical protein